jgi:hypothetical protein
VLSCRWSARNARGFIAAVGHMKVASHCGAAQSSPHVFADSYNKWNANLELPRYRR